MNPSWLPRLRPPWVLFDCDDESGRCVLCSGHARRLASPAQVHGFCDRHRVCAETHRYELGDSLVRLLAACHGERLGGALFGHRPFDPAARALLAIHPNDPLFDAYDRARGEAWYFRLVHRAGMGRLLTSMGRCGEARAFAALSRHALGVNAPDDGLLVLHCEDGHRVGAVVRWNEVVRWETEARAGRTLRAHLDRRRVYAPLN